METPDTVHGRLLESVHLSGYTFERACAELEWLLDEDRWKHIGPGFDDINAFLATLSFAEFRLVLDQRKQLAARLYALQASQRATARLLGVSRDTVQRDLGGRNRPAIADNLNKTESPTDPSGRNRPEKWFQTDIDPAADAKQREQRTAKEAKREARRDENRRKIETVGDPTASGATFATIVIDPPWDWSDEGDSDQLGRARPTYGTMTFDELRIYPVATLADEDCHCYLWITNRSLPKGFDLLQAWGFRYVTCLTWCKPSFGMGNYFRGSTEHVLFGLKGSQPLKRHDVGTHFRTARDGGHSTKPDAFYVLVESCSPGPYLDLFSRGWAVWGADVCSQTTTMTTG
jgi:N6-adenosine-specific RNA methylase IME4